MQSKMLKQKIQFICQIMDVNYRDVLGKSKRGAYVRVRKFVCVLLWDAYTLKDIGTELGGRHYSTVINAISRHKESLDRKGYQDDFQSVKMAYDEEFVHKQDYSIISLLQRSNQLAEVQNELLRELLNKN